MKKYPKKLFKKLQKNPNISKSSILRLKIACDGKIKFYVRRIFWFLKIFWWIQRLRTLISLEGDDSVCVLSVCLLYNLFLLPKRQSGTFNEPEFLVHKYSTFMLPYYWFEFLQLDNEYFNLVVQITEYC